MRWESYCTNRAQDRNSTQDGSHPNKLKFLLTAIINPAPSVLYYTVTYNEKQPYHWLNVRVLNDLPDGDFFSLLSNEQCDILYTLKGFRTIRERHSHVSVMIFNRKQCDMEQWPKKQQLSTFSSLWFFISGLLFTQTSQHLCAPTQTTHKLNGRNVRPTHFFQLAVNYFSQILVLNIQNLKK